MECLQKGMQDRDGGVFGKMIRKAQFWQNRGTEAPGKNVGKNIFFA